MSKYMLTSMTSHGKESEMCDFSEACRRLRKQTRKALTEISRNDDLKSFCFGKTYTKKSIKSIYFDPMDYKTWYKWAIQERYNNLKAKGYDGMVVIACITKDIIKEKTRKTMQDPQTFAIALKNDLISYFSYQDPETRLVNDNFQPGPSSKGSVDGGIIFIAYMKKGSSTCTSEKKGIKRVQFGTYSLFDDDGDVFRVKKRKA